MYLLCINAMLLFLSMNLDFVRTTTERLLSIYLIVVCMYDVGSNIYVNKEKGKSMSRVKLGHIQC